MAVITGGTGNDTLTGGVDADSISGLAGNDTLVGNGGNDTLIGGAGSDSMEGGDGADRFVLDQTTGTDTITGGETGVDLDVIDLSAQAAGVAARIVMSGAEAGTVLGLDGAQLAVFTQVEQFVLTGANDVFTGSDSIAAAVNVDGGAGADSLTGTGGADTLAGGTGNDTLKGGGGADSLSGGADNDLLGGGEGNDTIDGGDGNDTIVEGGGAAAGTRSFSWANTFDGADPLQGAAQTLINGAPGAANLTGDVDPDKEFVFVQANTTSQQGQLDVNPELQSGERVQSLSMSLTLDMGSPLNSDHVDGFSFSLGDPTTLTGERENGVGRGLAVRLDPLANLVEVRWNGAVIGTLASLTLETRALGTLSVTVSSAGVVSVQLPGSTTPDLTATIPGGQWATVDQSGWQYVFAGRTGANVGFVMMDDVALTSTITTPATTGGNDLLQGGAGNDTISGGAGTDFLSGGIGTDLLDGGSGNDTLAGGDGNDTLDGGTGNDSLLGEGGDDLFRLSSATGAQTIAGGETGEGIGDTLDASALSGGVTLTLATPESGAISGGGLTVNFAEIERVVLTAGADTAAGSAGADWIDGAGGNDLLRGGQGADTLGGGSGTDTLVGGGAGDSIDGGDGNDLIYGGSDSVPVPLQLWANDSANRLFRIDINGTTATRTQVGTTAQTFGDIAMDASGRLFGISGGQLYRIDTTTAQTTLIGFVGGGPNSSALSFGPDGLLYTSAGSGIIRFSPDTPASATTVWTNPGGGAAAGDFLIVGDRMFASWVTPGGTTQLLRLSLNASNIVTGFEVLGTLPAESYGLALGPNGEIYVSSGVNLFQVTVPATPINGGTGALTLTQLTNGTNASTYWGATSNYEARLGDGVDGPDSLSGGAGNDTLYGDVGADTLSGGTGNDSLEGGAGNDLLQGGAGSDVLTGGDGDDRFGILTGDGADTITGGETGETLGDLLDASGMTAGATLTLASAESGTLVSGADSISFTEVERILLGAGNDSVTGSAGNDSVDAGAGNDTLTGGAGNDTLAGGAGSDLLTGGAGNDSLDGGAGDDDFVLGAGDSASGGDGDDEFRFDRTLAGNATITVTGGETGEDLTDPTNGGTGDVLDLRGLPGVDITWNTADPTWNGLRSDSGTAIYQNSGGQTVTLQFSQIERILTDGDGTVTGTAGNDSIGAGYADAQGDRVDGWDGANDVIAAGAGDDTVSAGAGNDIVDGGTGNDLLAGGAGNDSVSGGDGNDTLVGGAGDTLLGGDGDDVFRFDRFATGTAPLSVTGGQNFATGQGDVLSLQGLTSYTATWTGGNKASGSGTLTYLNANGDLVTVTFSQIERIICFARDTLIATHRGDVAVQDLRLGDLILTADRGYQPMRWLAARRLSAEDLAAAPNLRPIRIRAGALGCGLPLRDLTVSPQHRILIRSKVAERMFGSAEVLVAAKQLLELDGVEVVEDGRGVDYWHLMCDRHEVIFAEGLEAETLFTGPEALAAMPKECLGELRQLFPDIAAETSRPAVRPLPKAAACRQLVHRHILNRKPMLAAPWGPSSSASFAAE